VPNQSLAPSTPTSEPVDLVIVGAGIVGLGHAVEAVSRGLTVTVLDRDERAVGASIRNFGHVGTTVQDGQGLEYALLTRERWLALADKAGFDVEQVGTVVAARTDAELGVLEEFAADRGPEQVRLLTGAEVRAAVPPLTSEVIGGAHLPLDLRVDPRAAVPTLAAWLADEGVTFGWDTHVGGIDSRTDHDADGVVVHTGRGPISAARAVLAVGHDLDRLFPEIAEEAGVRRCLLRMLEVAPPADARIAPAVLTGTSLLRYAGFTRTRAAAQVRAEIEERTPELLDAAVNLMLTQRPDGSLVLGDTHRYERTHGPFDDDGLEALLLREGARLLGGSLTVRRRWRGVYADSPQTDFLIAAPRPGVRAVAVTSGIGMTTGLGLAPTVIDQLF